MSEALTYVDPSVEEAVQHNAPETGRISYETTGVIDASAAISLRKRDLRLAEAAREGLDTRFDGLLGRQTAPDAISLHLADDIDFRRAAQRAGFTDVDKMPADERASLAETAAETYRAEITTELEAHHPEWASEQIVAATDRCIRDIVALLAMNRSEQERYHQSILDFHQANVKITEVAAEIEILRAERHHHLQRIGGFVVRSLVNGADKLRDLPYTVHSRLTIAAGNAAQRIRHWYAEKSPEGKQAVLFTAAGIAITGISAYILARLNGGHSGTSPAFELASYGSDERGNAAPRTIGTSDIAPLEIGADDQPSIAAETIGSDVPNTIGTDVAPTDIGTDPQGTGGAAPENIGTPGVDLGGTHHSVEFFSDNSYVEKWPDTITVSKWDSQTKDGSLWGISSQMLQRSGVSNPSHDQIAQLVDALRPQAQPDGWLRHGQTLDLRPALAILNA